MISVRGHQWDHMPLKYCLTCGGQKVLSNYRWRIDPVKGRVRVKEVCPTCKGTGKNTKKE